MFCDSFVAEFTLHLFFLRKIKSCDFYGLLSSRERKERQADEDRFLSAASRSSEQRQHFWSVVCLKKEIFYNYAES